MIYHSQYLKYKDIVKHMHYLFFTFIVKIYVRISYQKIVET